MQTYRYTALDQRGRKRRGKIEAHDESAAGQKLQRNGLLVADLVACGPGPGGASSAFQSSGQGSATKERSDSSFFVGVSPCTNGDRIRFLRELGLMLRSGLSLLQGLRVIADQTRKKAVRTVLDTVIADVESGETFSGALDKTKTFLPSFARRLIAGAQVTGRLEEALSRSAEQIERRARYKTKLISSLSYPSIVFVAAIGVALFLVMAVIPKFAAFVQKRGQTIPPEAQRLIDLSTWMIENGIVVSVVVGLIVMGFVGMRFSFKGRRIFDRFLLSLPLAGSLIKKSEMAQAGWTMSLMLKSGVTLSECLKVTSETLGNSVYQDCMTDASDAIYRGESLSNALNRPVVPRLMSELISVGEQTGELSKVLQSAGEHFDDALIKQTDRMAMLVEPAMLLLIGGMVGYVYLAFFKTVVAIAG